MAVGVAAGTTAFSFADAGLNFLLVAGGGIIVGLVMACLEGARSALDRLGEICAEDGLPAGNEQGMREYYENRIRRYEAGIEAGGMTEQYAQSSSTWRKWRRDLIEAERDAIIHMRDGGEISPETMRRIERDLDLEESRIGG